MTAYDQQNKEKSENAENHMSAEKQTRQCPPAGQRTSRYSGADCQHSAFNAKSQERGASPKRARLCAVQRLSAVLCVLRARINQATSKETREELLSMLSPKLQRALLVHMQSIPSSAKPAED